MTKEEARKGNIVKGVCAVICISLVGGYIYYVNNPNIIWKDAKPYEERIVDVSKEEYDNILNNVNITNKENNELNNNINTKNSKDYDKYGRPYLKEGQSYTFKDNGMGEPVEAPKNKKATVINPNNGRKFYYLSNESWVESDYGKEQAEIDKAQDREVGKQNNISREEIKQFMDGMTINMGSMK